MTYVPKTKVTHIINVRHDQKEFIVKMLNENEIYSTLTKMNLRNGHKI